MAEHSEISWTDATFNPWWGCAKVSPACDGCYAERDSKRFAAGMVLWGVDAERRVFGDKHWNEPLRWARTMPTKLGRRPRVFCASMADVFDKNAPDGARDRLWKLIANTPELDWLLLTKRIGNAKSMLPTDWGTGYANVILGSTVINQEEADRDIPKLLATSAQRRFLSIEPMLGPISFVGMWANPENAIDTTNALDEIDWVIVGGESGTAARPMQREWARDVRDQCATVGVPFHFKQWGEWAPNWLCQEGTHAAEIQGSMWMDRMGKKIAGRELDGVEHNGFPSTASRQPLPLPEPSQAASGNYDEGTA